MSLYRTYRPRSFADVAGQEHIVSTLKAAVEQDKLAHAYLFAGQRGTGKTSIARILAKSMLTRGIEDAKIKEQIIQAVEEGNLVDLTEIDAASNRGIDDIRSLLEKIQFSPVIATAKVYIIDEVHMLTREAFNALLKTLEEPPPYAFFILATTELHKIPATIQSRCQRFLFKQIREDDIVARMREVAEAEKIIVDDAALKAVAHHVQGSMRDALSLLDQLRSLPSVTLADVKHRIGETGHEYVEQMMAMLRGGDQQGILHLTRVMEENAVPLENFIRLMLGEAREALYQAVEEKRDTAGPARMLDALLQAVRDVRSAPMPVLVLESALLSLTQAPAAAPAPSAPPSPPPARPAAPPVAPASVASPAPAPASPVASAEEAHPSPELSFDSLKELWPEVLQITEPAFVRMSLKNGHLHGLKGNVIQLSFTSAFHRDKVSALEASRAIEAAMEKCFRKQLRIECLLESQVQGTVPAPAPSTDIVNLADAAADIF